jgi:hypothetical protein
MIVLNSGLQNRIQRLGVTPFVLFWNLVGHICERTQEMAEGEIPYHLIIIAAFRK